MIPWASRVHPFRRIRSAGNIQTESRIVCTQVFKDVENRKNLDQSNNTIAEGMTLLLSR